MKTSLILVLLAAGSLAILGCDKKQPANTAKPTGDTHTHADGTKHDDGHDHADHADDHHGEPIALGEGTFGAYKVKASRDAVEFKAGGEAPVDVWVDPAAAGAPKVTGVRFWIGSEDAKGSVKAKAEIEFADQPNRWHTHTEIPDPLPAGSKLWISIEDDAGKTTVASFDLKL